MPAGVESPRGSASAVELEIERVEPLVEVGADDRVDQRVDHGDVGQQIGVAVSVSTGTSAGRMVTLKRARPATRTL